MRLLSKQVEKIRLELEEEFLESPLVTSLIGSPVDKQLIQTIKTELYRHLYHAERTGRIPVNQFMPYVHQVCDTLLIEIRKTPKQARKNENL